MTQPDRTVAASTQRGRTPAPVARAVHEEYAHVRTISEGMTGTLYEARHVDTGTRVALEILRPELSQDTPAIHQFLTVLCSLSAAKHESIRRIFDARRAGDGSVLVAMQYLEGENLRQRLERLGGPMSAGRAAHITYQILEALAAAHRGGVLHLDLRPENVFLVHQGSDPDSVRLLNFGNSVLRSPLSGSSPPHYIAPEQVSPAAIDHRADLYACGALLYHLVAGRPPYSGASREALLAEIAAGNCAPPRAFNPNIPDAFEAVVLRAIAPKPEARFQSAQEFCQALAPYRVPLILAGDAATSSPRTSTGKGGRRKRLAIVATACVATIAVAGAALLLTKKGRRGAAADSPRVVDAGPPVDAPPPPPDAGLADAAAPDAAVEVRSSRTATLSFRVTPRNAHIKVGKKLVRGGSVTLPIAPKRKLLVTISAKGYRTKRMTVTVERDRTIQVALKKKPAGQPAPPPPPPPPEDKPPIFPD